MVLTTLSGEKKPRYYYHPYNTVKDTEAQRIKWLAYTTKWWSWC